VELGDLVWLLFRKQHEEKKKESSFLRSRTARCISREDAKVAKEIEISASYRLCEKKGNMAMLLLRKQLAE